MVHMPGNGAWARKNPELIFPRARNPLRILKGHGGPFDVWSTAMPMFFFSVRHGEDACVNNDGAEFADHNAAWKEMTGVCGDMIADISRQLSENAEWQMELLDESRKPVFRIRLVAETLQDAEQEAR
jgi:hypothetical protein